MDKISTNNLTVGETFKNYKELCAALGATAKDGKSRQLQLKEFERYFNYEKSGQKITITEIYDTPKPKVDKRKQGNKSIYVGCIELLLMYYLSKQQEDTCAMTKKYLWKTLGMVNSNYGETLKLQERYPSVTQFEIDNFYFRANKNLDDILRSALNSMKNRRLLEWNTETVIVTNTSTFESHIASEEEQKLILDTEHYVLTKKFGFEKIIQVICRGKQKEFYEAVNEILYEKIGCEFYFKQIKLIFNRKNITNTIPIAEASLQRKILNEKVVARMNTDAQNTLDKWNNEYWGEMTMGWNPPSTYLMAQGILTDELIKIDNEQPDGI